MDDVQKEEIPRKRGGPTTILTMNVRVSCGINDKWKTFSCIAQHRNRTTKSSQLTLQESTVRGDISGDERQSFQ